MSGLPSIIDMGAARQPSSSGRNRGRSAHCPPTLFIWGDADDTVGRDAAEGTVDFVAAPYCFEELAGVGHFAADQAPQRVSELMLGHLKAHPV